MARPIATSVLHYIPTTLALHPTPVHYTPTTLHNFVTNFSLSVQAGHCSHRMMRLQISILYYCPEAFFQMRLGLGAGSGVMYTCT